MPKRLALLFLALTSAVFAQTPRPDPTAPALHFEVVNIHPSNLQNGRMLAQLLTNGDHNSHVDIQDFDYPTLLRFAFDIRPYQIESDAKIIFPRFYDLHLKGGEEADAAFKTMSDDDAKAMRMRMLQEMMAERFHLEYHWVARDMASLTLVAGKQPKLHRSMAKPLAKGETPRKDDPNSPSMSFNWSQRGCDMVAHGQSMEWFANLLKNYFPGQVADGTGLPGLWDFSMHWAMPWQNQMSAKASGTDDEPYPLIEAALAEQLDLKIEHGRAPVKVLVVDHIEAPTPN